MDTGGAKTDLYRSRNGRRMLQVVETCRSVVFVPPKPPNPGKLIVSEWRRRNGILDDDHSLNVDVDVGSDVGFISDASMLVAEKILAKLGRTGKFSKLGKIRSDSKCQKRLFQRGYQ